MPSFFYFFITKRFPSRQRIVATMRAPLSVFGIINIAACVAILISIYLLIIKINDRFLVTIPAHGGTITEGVIGAPVFINPLLAVSETDTALTELVFAGLMMQAPDGTIMTELADTVTISPDSKTYTFRLKETFFTDGTALTSKDVAFTVQAMQDTSINALRAPYWQSIMIDTPDDRTVIFRLPGVDNQFLYKATFGILPAHIWQSQETALWRTSAYNLKPISSGPFAVKKVHTTNGIPNKIVLTKNKTYALGSPLLKQLVINIYANQESLAAAIEQSDIDFTFVLTPNNIPTTLPRNYSAKPIKTDNVVGLYRIERDTSLSSSVLVTLLNQFIDKKKIIDTVENGYGIPVIGSPLSEEAAKEKLQAAGYSIQNGLLTKSGAIIGLAFATENSPRLLQIAKALSDALGSIGIPVTTRSFDRGNFREEVRSGNYSVILDRALPGDGGYTSVIPLYNESMAFVSDKSVGINSTDILISPQLRYNDAHLWYADTDRIWKWLNEKK